MILNERFDGGDDLSKRHPQDGKRVSNQEWEVEELIKKYKNVTMAEIARAKNDVGDSREKIEQWLQNHGHRKA